MSVSDQPRPGRPSSAPLEESFAPGRLVKLTRFGKIDPALGLFVLRRCEPNTDTDEPGWWALEGHPDFGVWSPAPAYPIRNFSERIVLVIGRAKSADPRKVMSEWYFALAGEEVLAISGEFIRHRWECLAE